MCHFLCYLLAPSFLCPSFFSFFFHVTATTKIYTLSLHDALPILHGIAVGLVVRPDGRVHIGKAGVDARVVLGVDAEDRNSTRLNSSHITISYAVFCLKKKTQHEY